MQLAIGHNKTFYWSNHVKQVTLIKRSFNELFLHYFSELAFLLKQSGQYIDIIYNFTSNDRLGGD